MLLDICRFGDRILKVESSIRMEINDNCLLYLVGLRKDILASWHLCKWENNIDREN